MSGVVLCVKGNAVGEDVRARPREAKRADPRGVEQVEVRTVRVDGLGAFEMWNRAHGVALDAGFEVVAVRDEAEILALGGPVVQPREHLERLGAGVCRVDRRWRVADVLPVDVRGRDERREQAGSEAAILRSGEVEVAAAARFEEAAALAVFVLGGQQRIVVAVDDRNHGLSVGAR